MSFFNNTLNFPGCRVKLGFINSNADIDTTQRLKYRTQYLNKLVTNSWEIEVIYFTQ